MGPGGLFGCGTGVGMSSGVGVVPGWGISGGTGSTFPGIGGTAGVSRGGCGLGGVGLADMLIVALSW